MKAANPQAIAVIGAGIAGAACARALILSGHSVHVFDKSRGAGGRLATRRVEWVDRQGHSCLTRLDHGAVAITAQSHAFRVFVDTALRAGWLSDWQPKLAAGSLPLEQAGRLLLPVPDMPSLCRHLLEGVATHWSSAVDALDKSSLGWKVRVGGEPHPVTFDAVLLALPPVQAAPLLSPHQADWAQQATLISMQPCWTLLGIAGGLESGPAWDVARPPTGLLGWVLRNESRPGRQRSPGLNHWVLHAREDWSRRHLEQPAPWVQQAMRAALSDWLGRPVDWQHCTVHRWRYALPESHQAADSGSYWWNAATGLGVCGDFLGGSGVEGAWLSAQSLCAALLLGQTPGADAPDPVDADQATQSAGEHSIP